MQSSGIRRANYPSWPRRCAATLRAGAVAAGAPELPEFRQRQGRARQLDEGSSWPFLVIRWKAIQTQEAGPSKLDSTQVQDHGQLGLLTGALPDGRRRGLALANGLLPCQGADALGPTAVINSNTKDRDQRRLTNGMVLDL